MITEIEDYFTKGCGRCARFDTPACSSLKWAEGQAALRRICREAGLEETLKWGHPCYMHAGRNIVIMGAFQDNMRLTFFNAGLMKDPAGVMEKQGAATATQDMIRFTDNAQVAAMEGTIRAYLAEAMGYAEAGVTAPKPPAEVDLPAELIAALDDDPELAEAFAALTPGRRKSYAIVLNALKKPETRVARIAKVRDRILAGKGAMDR
ncbi:MAG: hypothetical protein GC146_07155 [Limimaricola sp.]|uniref:YdeI/OmpD-associated family protein n=1 Tax=Limimaricola sp. TaxID=2211665 RepID=UPI001D331E46|nr:YdeI/OmpD-associated family protein [Limimaricola sp.]MBI1416981.1 hypothetical protein [Limimaricola sp.]